jgi:hypothetical protein
MGLLDDAIREHLELKRKHGASDQEISLQEAEALGPARREVAPVEAEPAAEPLLEGAREPALEPTEMLPPEHDVPPLEAPDEVERVPFDAESAAVTENVPGAEEPPPAPLGEAPPVEEPPVEEPPVDEPPVEAPGPPPEAPVGPPVQEDPGFEDHAAELDPGRQAGTTPPHGFPEVGEERAPALDPDSPPALDTEAEGEDVLEETPDFLQETPEHDRLWFEQKPPRDFDFD